MRENYSILMLFTCAFVSLIMGCAYGNIVESSVPRSDIHQWIDENYDTFTASYSGTEEKPGAIRFDLKGDGVRLVGEGWYPIEGKKELDEMVTRMVHLYLRKYKGNVGALGPQLYRILDKNGKLIGYFFSAIPRTPVRPDGKNYTMDPVNELDVRNESYPWYRAPSPRGMHGGR
jgi:hypothetical protein